jgi:hypothetical protein
MVNAMEESRNMALNNSNIVNVVTCLQNATIKELLVMFSMRYALKLYNEDPRPQSCATVT